MDYASLMVKKDMGVDDVWETVALLEEYSFSDLDSDFGVWPVMILSTFDKTPQTKADYKIVDGEEEYEFMGYVPGEQDDESIVFEKWVDECECCIQDTRSDFVVLVMDPEDEEFADVLDKVDHANWDTDKDGFRLSIGMKFGPERESFFPGCTIKIVMLNDEDFSIFTFKDCAVLGSSFGIDNSEEKQFEYFRFEGKEYEVSFVNPDEEGKELKEGVDDVT